MPTITKATPRAERSRLLLEATRDVLAWLDERDPLIQVADFRVDSYCHGPGFAVEVTLTSTLAQLPAVVAELPRATVTLRAADNMVVVAIAGATPAGSPIRLNAYLHGKEAAALAETTGLNFPPRHERSPITTDTLAAAASATGQASDA
ncbi:hypothetical protein [Crossiella sp. S99.2]|uniref:hypothetical protein n=1 Tax=Crossiella sp. S99.2 TaxID=2936272 RepID=UPI001FFE8CF6|nr:hypothetical protein [Crossiella sp. S99.2]MCK2238071.1 hypothetical protein [Crossiella sp. S99.2]